MMRHPRSSIGRVDRCSYGNNSAPEDCCAYTNAGTALLNGYSEVSGHAGRELGKSGVEVLLLVSQATQGLKVGASGLGVFAPWRDGHEADGGDIFERLDGVQKSGEFFGRDAVLGLFVGEFDFDVDREVLIEDWWRRR